jgi:hypothetical protein
MPILPCATAIAQNKKATVLSRATPMTEARLAGRFIFRLSFAWCLPKG